MRMRKKSRVCLTHCYKLVHFAINWLAINFILLSGPGVPIPFFFVVIGPNLALQPIVINCSYPKFEVHRYGLPLKKHLWSFHDEARKFSWALLLLDGAICGSALELRESIQMYAQICDCYINLKLALLLLKAKDISPFPNASNTGCLNKFWTGNWTILKFSKGLGHLGCRTFKWEQSVTYSLKSG